MTFLVSFVTAVGTVLLVSGLPVLRRPTVEQRVEAYLAPRRPRPARPADVGPTRVLSYLVTSSSVLTPVQEEALARRLEAAGSRINPREFRVRQVLSASAAAFCAGVLAATAAAAGLHGPRAPQILIMVVLSSAIGWVTPDLLLQRATRRRRSLLLSQLPAAAELLSLAVSAGESVSVAFERVADELGAGLGDEFRRTVADVRSGMSFEQALQAMGRRLDDAPTLRLVHAVATALDRGAPLGQVLRAQAADARSAQHAQMVRSAGRREVAMLVPVVFLILPFVVVVALLPALVSLNALAL